MTTEKPRWITKNDLTALRDRTEDPETKAILRWAVNRIENLQHKINEVGVLVKSVHRALGQKDEE